MKKNVVIIKQFHENSRSKTHRFWEINLFFRDANIAFMHREGLKGQVT